MADRGYTGDSTVDTGKAAAKADRRQALQDAFDQHFAQDYPEWMQGLFGPKRKQQTVRSALKKGSLGSMTAKLNSLSQQYPQYSEAENTLREGTIDRYGQPVDIPAGDYQRGQTPVHGAPDLGMATPLGRETVDYQPGGRSFFSGLEDAATTGLKTPDAGFEKSPMLSELSRYTRERLGTGLTPQEYNALAGPQIEGVEGQASQSRRSLGAQVAASGMDPRAAAAMMGGVENTRLQGRAGVNRDMVTRELARKGEMEQLGLGVSGDELQQEQARQQAIQSMRGFGLDVGRLGEGIRQFDVSTGEGARQFDYGARENARQFNAGLNEQASQFGDSQQEAGRQFDVSTGEAGRQFDTTTHYGRLGDLEKLMATMAQFGEGRREYDLGFADSRRQAAMNRELIQKMMKAAEPTALEKTGTILGGIEGGL